MGKRKDSRWIKNANLLDLVPVRLSEFKVDEKGSVTLLVPRTKSAFMRRIMERLNRSLFITIALDRIGSMLWLLIDGNSNTAQVVEQLQQKIDTPQPQLAERVVKYLSGLYHNKHITFV
jgi:hypothetical protein